MPRPGSGAPSGGGAPSVAVVVIDPDQDARSRLVLQLGQGVTPFSSLNELAQRLSVAVCLNAKCDQECEADHCHECGAGQVPER